MAYVADTHSLVWFFAEDKSLGSSAKQAFESAEDGKELIIIPIIVLAELMYISERKKRSEIFTQIISKIKDSTNYLVYDFNLNVLLQAEKLKKIAELHDRIIVATAILTNSKMITKDDSIKKSAYVDIIW